MNSDGISYTYTRRGEAAERPMRRWSTCRGVASPRAGGVAPSGSCVNVAISGGGEAAPLGVTAAPADVMAPPRSPSPAATATVVGAASVAETSAALRLQSTPCQPFSHQQKPESHVPRPWQSRRQYMRFGFSQNRPARPS